MHSVGFTVNVYRKALTFQIAFDEASRIGIEATQFVIKGIVDATFRKNSTSLGNRGAYYSFGGRYEG